VPPGVDRDRRLAGSACPGCRACKEAIYSGVWPGSFVSQRPPSHLAGGGRVSHGLPWDARNGKGRMISQWHAMRNPPVHRGNQDGAGMACQGNQMGQGMHDGLRCTSPRASEEDPLCSPCSFLSSSAPPPPPPLPFPACSWSCGCFTASSASTMAPTRPAPRPQRPTAPQTPGTQSWGGAAAEEPWAAGRGPPRGPHLRTPWARDHPRVYLGRGDLVLRNFHINLEGEANGDALIDGNRC